jgi:hypothetical protein
LVVRFLFWKKEKLEGLSKKLEGQGLSKKLEGPKNWLEGCTSQRKQGKS